MNPEPQEKTQDAKPGLLHPVVLPIVGAEYHTTKGETLFIKRAWIHPQAGPYVAWVKLLCAREFIEPLSKFQKRIGQNKQI